jgi:hypothetical protein
MRHSSVGWLVTLSLILIAVAVHGQQTSGKPMTNQDVIDLVSMGLSDDVVIDKIHASQTTDFDTSTPVLKALKAAKVSDGVIRAMINPKGASQPGSTPAVDTAVAVANSDPNDPDALHDPGIYLYTEKSSGKKMIMLEPTVYSEGKSGGLFKTAMTYGIAKAKWKAVVHNPHANIRTGDTGVVFYFYVEEKGTFGGSSSPNEFTLVRFDVKGDSRETTVYQMNAFGGSSGTQEKANVPFTSVKIRPGVYKITPNAPLKPGEYAFLTASGMGAFAPGAAAASRLFDFGVNPPQ